MGYESSRHTIHGPKMKGLYLIILTKVSFSHLNPEILKLNRYIFLLAFTV